MSTYQPAWRRPIARAFRLTAVVPVEWCIRLGVSANLVSCSSIAVSLVAGVCFWQAGKQPVLLVVGVLFCYLRLWLNMLDGMVALASATASRVGEIANELPDRVSDVIIFVGVAHSGLCQPLCGYWAAISALLVAYVGTLGQAIGVQREFSGLMSKPWRMVTLHAGAWSTLWLLWHGDGVSLRGGLTVLDGTLLAIILGCVQTVMVRLVRIVRAIQAEECPSRICVSDRVRGSMPAASPGHAKRQEADMATQGRGHATQCQPRAGKRKFERHTRAQSRVDVQPQPEE